MKTRHLGVSLILAAFQSGATAQIGVWEPSDPVDGPGGDGIVTPGEAATLKMVMNLKPDVGGTLPDGSTVAAFGSVIADVVGLENWNTGTVTWTVNPNLIFLTGDLTVKDAATQDLHNMNAGQIPDYGPFSVADPIDVITIRWEPKDYKKREVSVRTSTHEGSTMFAYTLDPGAGFIKPHVWEAADSIVTFHVDVPAPGALPAIALGAGLLARRRR